MYKIFTFLRGHRIQNFISAYVKMMRNVNSRVQGRKLQANNRVRCLGVTVQYTYIKKKKEDILWIHVLFEKTLSNLKMYKNRQIRRLEENQF